MPARTHGLSGTPEYKSWHAMICRCYDPKHHKFKSYGAKGITVCDRWLSVKSFVADMGRQPSPAHTLDRIDNKKGYYPENCRWATIEEQNNNKDGIPRIWFRGRKQSTGELIERYGSVVSHRTVQFRIFRRKWPVLAALQTPNMGNDDVSEHGKRNMRRAGAERSDAIKFKCPGSRRKLTVSQIMDQFECVVDRLTLYKRLSRDWDVTEARMTPKLENHGPSSRERAQPSY